MSLLRIILNLQDTHDRLPFKLLSGELYVSEVEDPVLAFKGVDG
jgi:hypothetical protein